MQRSFTYDDAKADGTTYLELELGSLGVRPQAGG